MSSPKELYDTVSKYFLITPALIFPSYFFINAPFGRFSPSKSSLLLFNGIGSWIVMEIASPLAFVAAFVASPLTRPVSAPISLRDLPPLLADLPLQGRSIPVPSAPALLVLLYLGHYFNRALLSPLRTPVRSKSHIAVPMSGVLFNVVNGSLMGAYLSAVAVSHDPAKFVAANNWTFWTGVGMWVLGFASNIWHDEILLNLRRNRQSTGSKKDTNNSSSSKPHYSIPHGGLYTLISYPNYASEWFEWLGYAIAASALTSQLPSTHVIYPFVAGRAGLGALSNLPYIQQLTPPWLFFMSEIFLMLPRAWNGHQWYLKTFPDYPRGRKVVFPFLL